MGTFINIGNLGFRNSRNGDYIDKSGIISLINSTINSERKFSCITRSRRFGKSMAAKMLCAYYDHSCDSRELFEDLEIANDPSFQMHLNKYPVIYLDLSEFMGLFEDGDDNIVEYIDKELKKDLTATYTDVDIDTEDRLIQVLLKICEAIQKQFILIIDEWDAICRENSIDTKVMDKYVDWLRRLFKGMNASRVFAAVYMTGILPIKRYDTQSALNNFWEYSMIMPRQLDKYFGFTMEETMSLADKYGMDFDELAKWYDGYQIGNQSSIFNPSSVIQAVTSGVCESYWASTAAYDAVANYINMDYEGLHDDIIDMIAGGKCKVNVKGFKNDLWDVSSRDDVLTVLIHLGYLSYDRNTQQCYIPNREVSDEMDNAVRKNNWKPVMEAIAKSERLLQDLLGGKEDAVAAGVEKVHRDNISILKYNDENALACVISLAFYTARNDYHVHREYPSGDGYADIVMIPRKNVNKPAIVIELKYNQATDTTISQIKRKHYPDKLAEYSGDILLVGINYSTDTKVHNCTIEPDTIFR